MNQRNRTDSYLGLIGLKEANIRRFKNFLSQRFSVLLMCLIYLFLAAPAAAQPLAGDACTNNAVPRTTPSSDFILIGDGSMVRHELTGLEWQRCAMGKFWTGSSCSGTAIIVNWRGALHAAANAGSDWRLPNINELVSIAEECRTGPAINRQVFPSIQWSSFSTSTTFWSASPSAGRSDAAWVVDFANGGIGLPSKNFEGRVRLVRGGQSLPFVSIDPPGLNGGTVNTHYYFTIEATNLPANLLQVDLGWSFGDGPGGTGQTTLPVSGGRATTTISYSYSSQGAYGLIVEVRDGNTLLAESTAIITIGSVEERQFNLTICDTWSATQSGGQGVTSDIWDISAIPSGARFDIEYDAQSIPDRYYVEYPVGSTVLDTGWRGATSSYNANPALYPGGLSGPGQGSVSGMFTKGSQNSFKVTVIGPDSRTAWDYRIRCRLN